MRVFLSHSGKRSLALAETLNEWLPRLHPLIEPWVSRQIPPGKEWRAVIMDQLATCGAMIVCVTPENVRSSPWPYFEGGAAYARCGSDHLIPVVLSGETISGPFEGLQIVPCSRNGIRLLVTALNGLVEKKLDEKWLDHQLEWLWPKLREEIENIKHEVPDATEEFYDDAIANINQYVKALPKRHRIDVITFYVRDYATPKEAIDFYLEAHIGLGDPAPMFGPIVFNDARKAEIIESEKFRGDQTAELEEASREVIGTRPRSFVGREKILSSALFRHLDSEKIVNALLNLNWRHTQPNLETDEARQQELREIAADVFKLLPTKPSISLLRSRLLTRELRARRYLGVADVDGNPGGDARTQIRGAVGEFLTPNEKDLDIEIITVAENRATKWRRDGKEGPCEVEPDWQWVQKTTKPLFLNGEKLPSSIIVPMRTPPALDSCKGIIMIRERAPGLGTLKSGMVRPLCSLGDTFGAMLRDQE